MQNVPFHLRIYLVYLPLQVYRTGNGHGDDVGQDLLRRGGEAVGGGEFG